MSEDWTGCAHCGQALPHGGDGWRESSRCRLFQRIAEQAWDEGFTAGFYDPLGGANSTRDASESTRENPYLRDGQ